MWWRVLVGAVARLRVVAVAGVLLAGVLVGGAPASASAAIVHPFSSDLGEASPGEALVEPTALAVDHATGQLFVADPGSGVVDVYGASGAYEAQFGEGLEAAGLALDESDGDVYVADPSEAAVLVYRRSASGDFSQLSRWTGAGTPGGAFGEVMGVAFDNSTSSSNPAAGDLYVLESEPVAAEGAESYPSAVDLYRPAPNPAGEGEVGVEGTFLGRLEKKASKLEEPNAIAVDSVSGHVLVGDSEKGLIDVFGDDGEFDATLKGAGSPYGSFRGKEGDEEDVEGVAVEEASGDIYVAEANHRAVSQYSPAGEWLGWTTMGAAGGSLVAPHGVAITGAGEVFVSEPEIGLVDRFGAGALVPGVETGKAAKSGITRTTAALRAVTDGDGGSCSFRFQYGETEALGSQDAAHACGAGSEEVSATIEGLRAGTVYYYRVVGESDGVVNPGLVKSFETPPAVEGVSTGAAVGVGIEGATLTGTLLPGGVDAHYFFEWGTTTGYGNRAPVPPADAGSGSASVKAEAALTGLLPNTTYDYRIVTENSFGATTGLNETFTTSGPPRVYPRAPSGVGHETATLNAEVNPGGLPTTYRFQYGETGAYGSEAPAGGAPVGDGHKPVVVSQALSGLKIGATYHYRVVAENSAGTIYGPDRTVMTVAPAPIEASYATGVSSSEVTLGAQIDPLGNETSYYFQYGSEPCAPDPGACTDIPAAPGASIGSGEAGVSVSQQLTGLQPARTYHYRVLASNALGTSEGPEHQFTTAPAEQPAFALADGRAWEMVTPADKHGAPLEALTFRGGIIRAAESGDALTYVADGAIVGEPPGNRSPEPQQMLSTRAAHGWSTEDIATPNTAPQGVNLAAPPEYEDFTPELSEAVVEPFGITSRSEPPLAPEAAQRTIYLREDSTGAFLPLVSEANAPGVSFGGELSFAGATPDLQHVVISSGAALGGPSSAPGLYEWSAGALTFVSGLPSGTPASKPVLGYDNVAANTISGDGSRIVWTVADEAARGHLYLHDTSANATVQLDAAKEGLAQPETGSAEYQTASAEGNRVFFLDKQRLTRDSTAEPAKRNEVGEPDLYECEIGAETGTGKPTCSLRDLTVDHNEGEHANVQGLIFGTNEEGTTVYLVAKGVLASNENGEGEAAEAGKDNLYVLQESGGQWSTRFIAGLSGEDSPEWEGGEKDDTAFLTARVSPNGQYLAFMSAAPLTGYDNVDASPEAKGARDEEVYLYDAASEGLTCVSCNPSGARPQGVLDRQKTGLGLALLVDQREIWRGQWLAGNIPGWTAQSLTGALVQSRYLSNEGRLFFNSPDDLVPQATNHEEDVYEYEPTGVGSCAASPTGGCVSLISGGGSEQESAFLEATPSGDDVFFLTAAQLLPQDTETAYAIYDAHVCTAQSPCPTQPAPAGAGCSETDACRPVAPSQPQSLAPAGTATATGAGDSPAAGGHAAGAVKSSKTSKAKPLTRAQQLARALVSCRSRYPHSRRRRATCEKQARRRYGPKHADTAKHASKAKRAKRSSRQTLAERTER